MSHEEREKKNIVSLATCIFSFFLVFLMYAAKDKSIPIFFLRPTKIHDWFITEKEKRKKIFSYDEITEHV